MENDKIINYIEEISSYYPNNLKNKIIKNKAICYFKEKKISFDEAKKEINTFLRIEKNEEIKSAEQELLEIENRIINLKKEMEKFYKKNNSN